ncbi:unnamed protein product, partial [Laminaria digitata]
SAPVLARLGAAHHCCACCPGAEHLLPVPHCRCWSPLGAKAGKQAAAVTSTSNSVRRFAFFFGGGGESWESSRCDFDVTLSQTICLRNFNSGSSSKSASSEGRENKYVSTVDDRTRAHAEHPHCTCSQ